MVWCGVVWCGVVYRFSAISGLALDPFDQNIMYVADASNHRIRSVHLPTGRCDTVAGNGSILHANHRTNPLLGSIAFPCALAFDTVCDDEKETAPQLTRTLYIAARGCIRTLDTGKSAQSKVLTLS